MQIQLELFPGFKKQNIEKIKIPKNEEIDYWILAFSGGKDSLACLIWLLENIKDRTKIELWHHEVDGDGEIFMDWDCTKSYCEAIAKAFDLPIYFSGLHGGFKGELLKNNQPHAASYFETPSGVISKGGKGKPGVRRKFPAKVANLRTRWCSSALKIDVSRMAIANQPRFLGKNIVMVTGERRSESTARSKYHQTQYYCQPNSRRTVYQYRPVLDWTTEEVWNAIARYKIVPHPSYQLRWGRTSCLGCIFGSPNQWATIRRDFPDRFKAISDLEVELAHTIDNKKSIIQMADEGIAYPSNPEALILAKSKSWDSPVFMKDWQMPPGAFGEQNGSI
jgi:3'-phosphoadenosine 5'-phosphosulfate sulfotransferase (PAPS reductase)/FAD synthetase